MPEWFDNTVRGSGLSPLQIERIRYVDAYLLIFTVLVECSMDREA